MHVTSLYVLLLLPIITTSLPCEGALKARNHSPRAVSYAIVNVDGGSSTSSPEPTTVTEDTTRTVQITDAGPTITNTVITTVGQISSSMLTSSSISPSSLSSSKSASNTKPTPATSVVTVVITQSPKPTQYYDDGFWHTSYAIKSF